MKHLQAYQQKGAPHRRSGRRDRRMMWSHCRITITINSSSSARMFRWDARWRFHPAGRLIRPAARQAFASLSNATSTIAM